MAIIEAMDEAGRRQESVVLQFNPHLGLCSRLPQFSPNLAPSSSLLHLIFPALAAALDGGCYGVEPLARGTVWTSDKPVASRNLSTKGKDKRTLATRQEIDWVQAIALPWTGLIDIYLRRLIIS